LVDPFLTSTAAKSSSSGDISSITAVGGYTVFPTSDFKKSLSNYVAFPKIISFSATNFLANSSDLIPLAAHYFLASSSTFDKISANFLSSSTFFLPSPEGEQSPFFGVIIIFSDFN
jgi:hypothetical protein